MTDGKLENPGRSYYIPNVAYQWSPCPRHFKTGRGDRVARELKNEGIIEDCVLFCECLIHDNI
jgi:hypothetical protein